MNLYKYVAPERVDVLQLARIRYTQPAALNDPFELKPYFQCLVPEDELLGELSTMDLAPSLTEAYQSLPESFRAAITLDEFLDRARSALETEEGRGVFWRTISMAIATIRDITPSIRDMLADGFAAKVGILSLSETADDPLMWAHYAAQHRGFVIGFDAGHQYFDRRRSPKDDFFQVRKVEYFAPQAGMAMRDLTAREVLLRKSPEWAYEREWRVLAPLSEAVHTMPDSAGSVYLLGLDTTAVTELIVGCRASRTLFALLRSLVSSDPRYAGVRLRQAVMNAASGELVLNDA